MPLLLIPLAFVAFLIFVLTRKKRPEPRDAELVHDALRAAKRDLVGDAPIKSLPSTGLARR